MSDIDTLRSRRLMKEWLEIQKCPLLNITIQPLNEENMNEWHGNIRGSEESEWHGIVVHFIVTFPLGYPSFPPRVRLCSFVPHLNVQNRAGSWEICLDMLESPPTGSLTIPYQYWSSAYTVRSILLQMSSFLLVDGQPTQTSQGTIDRTRTESHSHICSICGSSDSAPIPPFPSEVDVYSAPHSYPCIAVIDIGAQILQEKRLQRKLHLHQVHVASTSINGFYSATTTSEECDSLSSSDSHENSPSWITVTNGNRSHSDESLLSCSQCLEKLPHFSFSKSQVKKGLDRKCSKCLSFLCLSAPKAATITITPSALVGAPIVTINKSAIRREKKKARKKSENLLMDSTSGSRFSHLDEQILSPLPDAEEEWKDIWRSAPETTLPTECNMGFFQSLNRDTSNHLLSYLEPAEVLFLGASSRGVDSLCNDWLVWRRFFALQFPRSALRPYGPNSSWKRAYLLEVNGLSQELICFNSRVTKDEDILGIPIWYTTNPRTGCLDYATSTFDIISWESYSKEMVRRTVWGEKFTNFLPIYIDEEHFRRGLGCLVKVSREIVMKGFSHQTQGNYRNHHKNMRKCNVWMPQTDAEMVLTLLTKMMNTQVVLLCDKGIAASEAVLLGYCHLHRLLLAVMDTFPELKIVVRKRLADFAQKPETRVKERTPSLGELLAYLSVSDTYGWDQISMPYIKECFDRSVLWACTKDPSLATVVSGDVSRLDKYLETQKVSLRLTLFHAVFLRMLVEGAGSKRKLEACIERYDTFQGRPPLYLRRNWQGLVKEILQFNSWPQFFAISGIPLPSKGQLLGTLETSVANSLKKGYHSKDTVFEKVMKSGVSQILLKGETYSAPPNISNVQMMEKWRFDGHVVYLDASCLVYNFSDEHIGTIDYSHRTWSGSKDDIQVTRIGSFAYTNAPAPCIRHSGDVIDHEGRVGQHTIDIEIKRLPNSVQSLFFTVSAWNTTLAGISQPSAHLYDVQQDTELCSYKLQDENTKSKTAVIMCRLYRKTIRSRWELVSIGHVGFGRADDYDSILKDIKKYLATERNAKKK